MTLERCIRLLDCGDEVCTLRRTESRRLRQRRRHHHHSSTSKLLNLAHHSERCLSELDDRYRSDICRVMPRPPVTGEDLRHIYYVVVVSNECKQFHVEAHVSFQNLCRRHY